MMMFLWSLSGVPFGVYAVVQNFNIPIQIQPQCFCALCLVSWGQCLKFGWSVVLSILLSSSPVSFLDLLGQHGVYS